MIHCSHFSLCGGCSLPNVPYAEQLALKRAQLSSLLKLDVPPLVPSPREEGFRHKVAFVFGADASGRRIVMGHYAAQTRTIVPIDECPVHSERGNRLAFALRDELVRARVPPVLLRHVLIRTTESGREAVVMLVVTRNERVLRAPVRAFLARKDPPDGFFINVHDRPGPAMVGRETIRIAGRAHAREDALGSSFLIGPTAFFQTNVGAAGEVLRLVMEDVAGARHVLDLYSGSGLFTVPMAAAGMSVTAVEEHPQASEDAARNLRLNRVPDDRVRLIRARVEDTLPRLARTRFDAIVIDPPRQGCAAPVLPAIVQDLTPPRLIYVSCNPQILAADIPLIRRAGYTIARLQPVDMFPHTEHIETVVTFHRD